MRMCENCVFFLKSLSAIFSCYLVTGSTEAPRRRLDIGGSPGSGHWYGQQFAGVVNIKISINIQLHITYLNVNVYILDIYCNPSDQNSEELKHIKDVSNSISQSPNLERFYFGFVRF